MPVKLVDPFTYLSSNISSTESDVNISLRWRCRGVMVNVAGIGHGDTSSNTGLNAFHIALIPLGKV